MLKSIPADMCVRVRFTEEPIFKKCTCVFLADFARQSAVIQELLTACVGNVGLYQSKMRWGHLN